MTPELLDDPCLALHARTSLQPEAIDEQLLNLGGRVCVVAQELLQEHPVTGRDRGGGAEADAELIDLVG